MRYDTMAEWSKALDSNKEQFFTRYQVRSAGAGSNPARVGSKCLLTQNLQVYAGFFLRLFLFLPPLRRSIWSDASVKAQRRKSQGPWQYSGIHISPVPATKFD